MNKNNFIVKFSKVKTSLGVQRLIINLFEELKFEKTRKGIEDFKRYLEGNIPNVEQLVIKYTDRTGNGIVEILEDYLRLV